MSDFRKPLYDQYVSSFKGWEPRLSADALQGYYIWCEYKYLPFLKGIDAKSRILELGCGPGRMLGFLERHGFEHAEGIDVSREQVRIALQAGCKAKVADAREYLKGRVSTYDVILALDFIEHFRVEELMGIVPALFKSLQKGGRLILQTPNGEGLLSGLVIHGDLTHLTIFTPSSLKQLLRLSGFEGFRFAETGPVPSNLEGRLRHLTWNLIRFLANAVRWIESRHFQSIWTQSMICCCRKPFV